MNKYTPKCNGPYYIGALKFRTQKECQQYARNIINDLGPCTIQKTHKQFSFFNDLIEQHPEYDYKVGIGIKHFQFIVNPINRKALHAIVHRLDNTTMDYSWITCCNNKHKTESKVLNNVLRGAIKDDTIKYKSSQSKLICNFCKADNLDYSDYHVDHSSPSFKQIAQDFILKHPNIPTQFNRCPISKTSTFNECDKQLETEWFQYHLQQRNYQILCKTCNLQKH